MNYNDTTQQQNPELQHPTDQDGIAEGKRAGLKYAADVARNSVHNLYPQIKQEIQEEERARVLDIYQEKVKVVENIDDTPMFEAEMNILEQRQQEQQHKAHFEDESRNLVSEAQPMPADQVQVEAPSVGRDSDFLADARAGVDAAVMSDVERYLENSGSTN
jgi:hypothetical protein